MCMEQKTVTVTMTLDEAKAYHAKSVNGHTSKRHGESNESFLQRVNNARNATRKVGRSIFEAEEDENG